MLHPHTSNDASFSGERKQAKRIRSGDEDNVIVIDSDPDPEEPGPSRRSDQKAEEVDLTKVLKTFRVNTSSLA